jgi:hypothetical protein
VVVPQCLCRAVALAARRKVTGVELNFDEVVGELTALYFWHNSLLAGCRFQMCVVHACNEHGSFVSVDVRAHTDLCRQHVLFHSLAEQKE